MNLKLTKNQMLPKLLITQISSAILCSIVLAACNGGGSSSPTPAPTTQPEIPASEQFSADITNEITAINTTQNQTVTGVAFPTASLSNLSTNSLNAVSNVQAYMLAFESVTNVPIVWTFNGTNWESYNISNLDFTPAGNVNSIYATSQGLLIGGYDHNYVAKIYLFNPINGFSLYTTPQCGAYHLTVNNDHLVTMSQSSNYPDYQLCLAELNNGTWTDISPTTNTGLPANSYYLNLASINNSVTISGASDFYGDNMVNNIFPSMLSYITPNWMAQSTPPRENGHILLSSTQNKFGTIYAASLSNSFPDGVTLGTATISKYANGAWTLVNVPFLNGLNTDLIDLYPDNYGNIYATISYYPIANKEKIITTIVVESAPQ